MGCGIADDGFNLRAARGETEAPFRFGCIGHKSCGVARTARVLFDWHGRAGDAPDGIADLTHRNALSRPKVQHKVFAAPVKMAEHGMMRLPSR